MIILGIETSCDDTSCGIIRREDEEIEVLSNVTHTQLIHAEYGGVVPELAARAHVKNILPVLQKALEEAKIDLSEIDGIGVTYGPGLIGSLLCGVEFAKAFSYALKKPLCGVNHLEAHIYSLFLENKINFPFICLIVSGGHTDLLIFYEHFNYKLLGTTVDDAAGEALDKVGRLLGLEYPGGPAIDRISKKGNPKRIDFPRMNVKGLDFSFSGIKTSALYYIKRIGKWREIPVYPVEDIAASFQEAVVDSLIMRIMEAVELTGVKRVGVCGGVARNSRLREKLREMDIEVFYPSGKFCTDNGAMVALCASYYIERGIISDINLTSNPSLHL